MGTGRWNFPAISVDDLYYKLTEEFMDPANKTVVVDMFMLDTVQWTGLGCSGNPTRNVNASDEDLKLMFKDAPVCKDDPFGNFAAANSSCSVVSLLGCDFDVSATNLDDGAGSKWATGTLLKSLCPVTCGSCATTYKMALGACNPCADDPGSLLAKHGGCEETLKMGCDKDVHLVIGFGGEFPKGSFVSTLCPKSCDACGATELDRCCLVEQFYSSPPPPP